MCVTGRSHLDSPVTPGLCVTLTWKLEIEIEKAEGWACHAHTHVALFCLPACASPFCRGGFRCTYFHSHESMGSGPCSISLKRLAGGLCFTHFSDTSLGHVFTLPSISSLILYSKRNNNSFLHLCTSHYLYFSTYSYCLGVRLRKALPSYSCMPRFGFRTDKSLVSLPVHEEQRQPWS